MALPPQIVCHKKLMRCFLFVLNHFLKKVLKLKYSTIEIMKQKAFFSCRNSTAFIPKPKPTTEICNNTLVAL
jgi:hypothetical protein